MQIRTAKPDFPISGNMLLAKANEFVDICGYDKVINMSWINRWKSRHQISFKWLIGEASSVDPAMVNEWLNVKVPLILEEYQAKDIRTFIM